MAALVAFVCFFFFFSSFSLSFFFFLSFLFSSSFFPFYTPLSLVLVGLTAITPSRVSLHHRVLNI